MAIRTRPPYGGFAEACGRLACKPAATLSRTDASAADNRQNGSQEPAASRRRLASPRRWQPAVRMGRASDWRGWRRRGLARGDRAAAAVSLARRCASALGILLFFPADGEPALWAPLSAAALVRRRCAVAFRSRARARSGVCVGLAMAFAGFRRRSSAHARRSPRRCSVGIDDRDHDGLHRDGRGPAGRASASWCGVADLQGVARGRRCPRLVRVTVRRGDGLARRANSSAPTPPAAAARAGLARRLRFRPRRLLPRHRRGRARSRAADRRSIRRPRPALTLARRRGRGRRPQRADRSASLPPSAARRAASARRWSPASAGSSPRPTNDVLRAAGIYHIVSISGLHMVLAAGTCSGSRGRCWPRRRGWRCAGR